MAHCSNCGSPLYGPGAITDQPVKCPFCDAMNAPAPKEVMVAVPVQIVNNVVLASDGGAVERRCPHCKKRLVTVVADGVSLSGCGACGGIWVDNASARSVLTNPESVFADLARRAAAGATGSRGKSEKPTCAECPAILDRASVHGIELDVCADHGTWFDARELETLVKILRHEPTDEPAQQKSQQGMISCQMCHQMILEQRANVTEYGLCCEACWREQTRELIATSEAKMDDRGVVVGGIMLGVAAAMLGASTSSQS
jgi:Zn-finger nucleic acid-binding protein